MTGKVAAPLLLNKFHIIGYRSIRELRLPLGSLTVVVGANGAGKSNLYRALALVAAAARGELSRALAEEGGLPSVMWAGARRKNEGGRLAVECVFDELAFEFSAGVEPSGPDNPSLFKLDPEVKEERVYAIADGRKALLLERKGPSAFARTGEGERVTFGASLWPHESVLAQLSDPHRFPVVSALRALLTSWRFYHQFRSDSESPLRVPQIGVRTRVLASDGRDLAAALQTIIEIGDAPTLRQTIARAFPGGELLINESRGEFSIQMEMSGIHRPLDARELSDGTLRFLCLAAALLTPRPPPLMAFNEPETSLHPDLMEPLAELLIGASRQTQIWVTTHSERLVSALERSRATLVHRIEKRNGATELVEE